MSAPETTPAVAPVEEVKAVETPAAEVAPVVEAAKVEEVAPVCFFCLCSICQVSCLSRRRLPSRSPRLRCVSFIHLFFVAFA